MSVRHLFAVFLLLGLVGPFTFGQDNKKADDKAKDTKKTDKKTDDKKSDDKKKEEKKTDDGGTVDLKWKFKKGETFYQEMTTDTKQTMKVSGMDITQNQKQTFYFSWTVKDEKDGSWIVEQKIIGAKMDINIGGQPINFDSTKEGPANPLTEFFKKLVDSTFTLTIAPDYKITKIEGREEFLKKLISQNPQMEKLLKDILSDDALKQMAEPAFAMLPGKPVKKGDTWTRDTKLKMGPIGTYDTKYTYTYEGKEEKLDKIGVKTALSYTPPEGGGGQLPFKIKEAKLKSSDGSGTVLFNNEAGRLASSDVTVKLDGTLKIEVTGMDAEVELTQTQKTTVKTSDKNPLEKK